MTNDRDLELIDKVLAGDQLQYAQLVDAYKRYVFTIALKILQEKSEAEEAAQDTFIKAYNNLHGFNREAKFSTWLYRIAFNTAISYKRRQRQPPGSIENTVAGYDHNSEGALEKSDKVKFLNQAMDRLNEVDRTALTLFYLKEFSLEEMADIMNMQANTIKVRLHRARQRVADELKMILQKEALTL